jgi:YVTN family beta-propeller protein
MRSFAALLLVLIGCGRATAPPPTRVFVSNEDDGTIAVIDARSATVIETIAVGKRPRGLRVSADGRHLYVALSGSPKSPPGVDASTLPPPDRRADGIGVVDLERLELVRVLESGQDPEAFDLAGELLVVSNEETAEASVVEVATGRVRERIDVGGEPEGVATHPDGDVVYVGSEEDHRIDVVDPFEGETVAVIATGRRPRGIAFTADGERAFVADETGGSVTVIDAEAHAPVATVAIPEEGSAAAGPRPMGVALSRDGARAFVTTGRGGSIAVIDVADATLERVIGGVGARPWGIAVARDGLVYTANGPSGDVAVVDPGRGVVVARIPVGASPWGVAIHP